MFFGRVGLPVHRLCQDPVAVLPGPVWQVHQHLPLLPGQVPLHQGDPAQRGGQDLWLRGIALRFRANAR